MNRIILSFLFFVTCSIHAIAQTDYYYHNGNKIPLTLNEKKVVVSIPKEYESTRERIADNVKALFTMKDESFDCFIITREDYEKLTSMDFWAEDAKSIILTSSYFTESNKEVFATPYLSVKLKTEEDADLLALYAEKYGLVISNRVPLTSLWYILYITPASEKNTLECANELYESGDFASAVPDFASNDIMAEETNIRSFINTTPNGFSEAYDLQGRRLTGEPQKGVYIRDGKKYVR